MALSVMINLDDMLFAAYNLGAEISETTPRLSKEELRAKLLADVPLIASANERPNKPAKKTKTSQAEQVDETSADEKPEAAAAADKTKTEKPKAEKKPKAAAAADKPKAAAAADKPKAEKKPKAEPEGDVRCCARSLYEKDHIEAGKPKAMRDDEANQFGDRCKFKKVGETNFCKSHAEKQPHGVWGAEYAGKLKTLIEKMNAPVEEPKPKAAKEDKPKAAKEPKPKAAKEDKPKTKKVVKKAAKPATEESEEPKTPTKKATKPVKPNAPKRPAKDEESDVEEDSEDEFIDADPLDLRDFCEIDDIAYAIDAEGNVYELEDDSKVGVYDVKAKKWISGGPAADEE